MLQPNPHHLCIKQVANDPKEAQGAKQPRSTDWMETYVVNTLLGEDTQRNTKE